MIYQGVIIYALQVRCILAQALLFLVAVDQSAMPIDRRSEHWGI
jgi:hypothetical protein